MRRLRISTWLLAAIFLAALALFILFRPPPASSGPPGKSGSSSRPTTTVPGMPFPGVVPSSSPQPSQSGSPTSG
jgi:hypothetical protein